MISPGRVKKRVLVCISLSLSNPANYRLNGILCIVQVIAIVTDRLTDGAVIGDLHNAASRGVPVYIILNQRSIQENFTLNRLRHPVSQPPLYKISSTHLAAVCLCLFDMAMN